MIGGIWKMLGFHAEGVAEGVDVTVFAGDGSIQEIANVKLQSGFAGPHFHFTAGGGFRDTRLKKDVSLGIMKGLRG